VRNALPLADDSLPELKIAGVDGVPGVMGRGFFSDEK